MDNRTVNRPTFVKVMIEYRVARILSHSVLLKR